MSEIKAKPTKFALLWLISAALCILITLVGVIYFIINIIRDVEVISVKSNSNHVMSSNIENINQLNENINALQTNAGLLRVLANPNDNVFDVIGNTMPNKEDAIALAGMIQNNIFGGTGVKVDQVVVGSSRVNDDIGEIDISFTVSGNFNQIIKASQRLENSIRPILIKSLSVSKNENRFTASYTAMTFYIPINDFIISEIEVAGQKIPIVDMVFSDIEKPSDKIFSESAINPNAWKQEGVGDGPPAN